MGDPVKFWHGHDNWAQAEQAWDARAAELAAQAPLRTFKKNPNLPGIRPGTRRFLAWKSLSYLHRHDHSGKLRRYFWRHPLRHGIGLVKSLLRGRSYHRDGDFFLYGIIDVADFVRRLEQPNAVLVVGFSYCHKPFECPAGRFTDQCSHDRDSPVCGQCFIGKAVHSLPEVRVIPLFITTVHYIGEQMIAARAAWPGHEVLFLITACELTLEMFGLVGCAVGLEGIGVRLDGQICNTMKAFAASEIGIKPGMAIVTEPTQARMMAILHAFADATDATQVEPGNANPARANLIATDRR